MKTATAATKTSIALRDTTFVTCWRVDRADGTIQTFTEHDLPIFVDLGDGDGLLNYKASSGYSRSAISSTATFSTDNLDIQGFLDPAAFSVVDIEAGRYDLADIRIFMVDWTKPEDGIIKFRRGYIGDIDQGEAGFTAELRGLLERYVTEIAGLTSPTCRADLGDQPGFSPSIHGCKVRLDPPAWTPTTAFTVRPPRDAALGSVVKPTVFNDRHFKCSVAGTSDAIEPSWNLTIGGTTTETGGSAVEWITEQALTIETEVSSVVDRGEFSVSYTGDAPDALLKGGLARFLAPSSNAGLNMEIRSWDLSTKTVILGLPMPFDIVADGESILLLEDDSGDGILLEDSSGVVLLEGGDIVNLQAGCAKDRDACKGFDNIFNIRAEHHVPGVKVIFRTAANQ